MNKINGPLGRIKFGPKAALLAAVLGCVSFANGVYAQEVIIGAPRVEVVVPAPPILVVPPPLPGFFLFGGGGYDGRREAHDYGRRGYESRGMAHHDRDHDHDGDRGGRRR